MIEKIEFTLSPFLVQGIVNNSQRTEDYVNRIFINSLRERLEPEHLSNSVKVNIELEIDN
jgi:hypothetical protein